MTNQAEAPEFRNAQIWQKYLEKLASQSDEGVDAQHLLDLRLNVYSKIEKIRNRPLIVYASKFIGASEQQSLSAMDLDDVAGFTDLVESIESEDSKAVDVLIQSPGGAADAAERIVHILRQRFNDVAFLVPHSAYSAATMLALSGNQIILHPTATLGPIDPQINGVPARSIKRGFDKARQTIETSGPEALPAYIPLIEKYSLHLLEVCEDAESLARNLVTEWLENYMFSGSNMDKAKIKKISNYFSEYDHHLTHSRPITCEKLRIMHRI